MMVRGETYIQMLKILHIKPTIEDLFEVSSIANIVMRITAANKTASPISQIPNFF